LYPSSRALYPSSRALYPSSRATPLIQGLRTSSRGCGPHPGVADLIQGDPSVNGLFLNKYEYVFAKCFKGVEYLCWISLVWCIWRMKKGWRNAWVHVEIVSWMMCFVMK
jgi:hypothetical protein